MSFCRINEAEHSLTACTSVNDANDDNDDDDDDEIEIINWFSSLNLLQFQKMVKLKTLL